MEPVLGGRDDFACSSCLSFSTRRNGARPWRTGRRLMLAADGVPVDAAMEPVLGGRDDAQSIADALHDCPEPQWSPSLADGTTRNRVSAA